MRREKKNERKDGKKGREIRIEGIPWKTERDKENRKEIRKEKRGLEKRER